ncbi:hypothetical protein L3Y34_005027 [Caenorhabditis briggsae]|uniref:Uncharacterized protein n=1 Tax=Caenorhabditis briggsae TaxID=6238 RepID=A0AAE9AGY0_CAEBR|nr:hypothetical protein L3Y34_005027 [Caenorhabditis briggsae]
MGQVRDRKRRGRGKRTVTKLCVSFGKAFRWGRVGRIDWEMEWNGGGGDNNNIKKVSGIGEDETRER